MNTRRSGNDFNYFKPDNSPIQKQDQEESKSFSNQQHKYIETFKPNDQDYDFNL